MSESVTLNVTGMKCGGCESAITEKLFADDGVMAVTASHQNNVIDVEYDGQLTNLEAIKKIIEAAGYSVN